MEDNLTTIQVTKDIIQALKGIKKYPRETYNDEIRDLIEAYRRINPLPTINDIKRIVIPILRVYGIKEAAIFGSFARGDANENSDVDLLIDPPENLGIKLVNLLYDLKKALGREVDLVSYNYIDPYIKERVLKESIILYGKR